MPFLKSVYVKRTFSKFPQPEFALALTSASEAKPHNGVTATTEGDPKGNPNMTENICSPLCLKYNRFHSAPQISQDLPEDHKSITKFKHVSQNVH